MIRKQISEAQKSWGGCASMIGAGLVVKWYVLRLIHDFNRDEKSLQTAGDGRIHVLLLRRYRNPRKDADYLVVGM